MLLSTQGASVMRDFQSDVVSIVYKLEAAAGSNKQTLFRKSIIITTYSDGYLMSSQNGRISPKPNILLLGVTQTG